MPSNANTHFTCQRCRVSKGSNLGITKSSEQGDNIVHKVLVIDDGILTLLNQMSNKVTEIGPKLLPLLTSHDEWVLSTFLKTERESRCMILIECKYPANVKGADKQHGYTYLHKSAHDYKENLKGVIH